MANPTASTPPTKAPFPLLNLCDDILYEVTQHLTERDVANLCLTNHHLHDRLSDTLLKRNLRRTNRTMRHPISALLLHNDINVLLHTVQTQNLTLLARILSLGPDVGVDIGSYYSMWALITAVQKRDFTMVSMLLDAGISPLDDDTDIFHRGSAIDYAFWKKDAYMAMLLVGYVADENLDARIWFDHFPCKGGFATLLLYAELQDMQEVVKILMGRIAKNMAKGKDGDVNGNLKGEGKKTRERRSNNSDDDVHEFEGLIF